MSFFGFKRFKCYLPYAFVTDLPTEISPSQGAVLLTLTWEVGRELLKQEYTVTCSTSRKRGETLNPS